MAQRSGGQKVKKEIGKASELVPITIVGTALAASLMVLLLLSKSQLSQMGFEISALEEELESLKSRQDKLLIVQTEAYRLERVEQYAKEVLGMVHPNPDQYRWIDIE